MFAIFFLLVCYGLSLSFVHIPVIEESLEPVAAPGVYDYRGAINVHTQLNQGSGDIQEIAKAGLDSGLDYVMLSDLNTFGTDPVPGSYHRQLLMFGASQVSYLDSRILLLDISKSRQLESLGQAQTMLADLLSQSGDEEAKDLIVLSHPFNPDMRFIQQAPSGLDGIEVLNLKSVWENAWAKSKASFFWSLLIYPFNSHLALLRLYQTPEQEIQMWDQLSAKKHAVGLVGAEATARAGPIGDLYVKFPSYQTFFSLASNHVLLSSELTGEAEADIRKIGRALSLGQFYFSLDVLGNPKGFNAYLNSHDKVFPMGSKVKYRAGLKLNVKLPRKPAAPFEISIFKDGQHLMSVNSPEATYDLQGPGVYRVVVRVVRTFTIFDGQKWVDWIYTNPFYVK